MPQQSLGFLSLCWQSWASKVADKIKKSVPRAKPMAWARVENDDSRDWWIKKPYFQALHPNSVSQGGDKIVGCNPRPRWGSRRKQILAFHSSRVTHDPQINIPYHIAVERNELQQTKWMEKHPCSLNVCTQTTLDSIKNKLVEDFHTRVVALERWSSWLRF